MKSSFQKFAVAIAAIMTIGSVALVSCDKDPSQPQPINETTSVNKSPIDCYQDYIGAEIPVFFDEIGVKHNDYLDSIGVALLDTLIYYDSIGHSLEDFGFDTIDIIAMRTKSLFQEDLSEFLNLYYEKYDFENDIWSATLNTIESSGVGFFGEQIGYQLQDIVNLVDETEDIDAMRTQIRAIEAAIINSACCIEDTVMAFSLSTWEHSLDYWNQAISNTSNPWHTILSYDNPLKNTKTSLSQKGLFSSLKHFVSSVVSTVRSIFQPKVSIKEIALCDLAGAASMAVNGQALIAVSPLVYGLSIVASGALTSAGCAILNNNI